MKKDFNWLPLPLRENVRKSLEARMPRGRGKLFFRNIPKHLGSSMVNGKIHIVFVSYYPASSVMKKSAVIRESGRYYTTILACCIREDMEPYRFFDEVYEVEDYKELFRILRGSRPWAFSVFMYPWLPAVLAIEAREASGVKVVIDINDAYFFIDRDRESIECLLEKEILNNADVIIHKMPHEAVCEMRSKWGFKAEDFQIQSLPLKQLFQKGSKLNGNGQIKLVLAGGIIPYNIAVTRGYRNNILDPLVCSLSGSNTSLSVFVNQNARNMYWNEHRHYFELAERYSWFGFEKGVPFFELPQKISKYHYGIFHENYYEASFYYKHFKYNVATKIFSYLEAGLPIIVHDKADYMRDIVKEHRIGLIYSIDKLEDIPYLVLKADHEQLRANVERFRDENNMASNLTLLEKIFK